MPENGHLNGYQEGGEKGYFGLRKWNFPVSLLLDSGRGRGGSQDSCALYWCLRCFTGRKSGKGVGLKAACLQNETAP